MIDVRRAEPADQPAVLALLRTCMGWASGDADERFFAWKHWENPFGTSPAWVAVDGDRVAGYRTFLRWEFEREGKVVPAVRAVDTATHPDYRGQGIFSRLTLTALDELRDQGAAFVFNTPNDQSRPGYLKMGWEPIGRLAVRVRPRDARSLVRLARARQPAERWSLPSEAGVAAEDALAGEGLDALLASLPGGPGLRTRRTREFLRWRYASPVLRYRALRAGAGGMAIFRLRRRGAAVEATVADVLTPGGDQRLAHALLRAVALRCGADYALRLDGGDLPAAGYLPLPGQGPLLVWRPLADPTRPAPEEWRLVMGDIELF